jgi:hypothetical protein
MKLLTSVVLATGLMAAAGVSSADSLSLTPSGPAITSSDPGTIPTTLVTGPSFSTDYFFTLGSGSNIGGNVVNISFTVIPGVNYDISNLTATLFNASTNTIVPGDSGSPDFQLTLPAGGYYVQVAGDPDGSQGGFYGGAVSVISAVPLPAAAWLLFSGVAGLAAMARRRGTRAAS